MCTETEIENVKITANGRQVLYFKKRLGLCGPGKTAMRYLEPRGLNVVTSTVHNIILCSLEKSADLVLEFTGIFS